MRKLILILILCIVHCALCIDVWAQNDRNAERRVKEAVAELKRSAYEGRYTLLYYNAQMDENDKQSGEIALKGNRFRMTLGSNETRYDGTTQWVYVAEYNEVSLTEPTEEELRELNPLAMIEHHVANDRIVLGEDEVIIFYPANPKESQYIRVELQLNKSNLPTQLIVYQTNGDRMTIYFENLKRATLDNSYFIFDPTIYPNVELNDLR